MNKEKHSSSPIPRLRGDQRMYRAVAAKQANPRLSLLDALVMGGFVFPELWRAELTDKTTLDADGVSLTQRKNQLNRRLRKERSEGNTILVTSTSMQRTSNKNEARIQVACNKPQGAMTSSDKHDEYTHRHNCPSGKPDASQEEDIDMNFISCISLERNNDIMNVIESTSAIEFGCDGKSSSKKKAKEPSESSFDASGIYRKTIIKDSPSRFTNTPTGILEIPTSSLGELMTNMSSANTTCTPGISLSQDPELDFDLDQLAVALGLGHL